MSERRYKTRELIQGLGSLWLVMLAILFLGDRTVFYRMLSLSLIAFGLLLALVIIIRKRRFDHIFKQPADQSLLVRLSKMSGEEFEDFIADLYRRLGYETERISGTRDGGVDVAAKKDGVIYYIECKKYYKNEVGAEEFGEFDNKFKSSLAVGKGIVITTNTFTKEAEELAADKPIELVDGFKLLEIIKSLGKK